MKPIGLEGSNPPKIMKVSAILSITMKIIMNSLVMDVKHETASGGTIDGKNEMLLRHGQKIIMHA